MEIDKQRATLLLLACTLLLLLFSGSIVFAYGQQPPAAPPSGNNDGAQRHYPPGAGPEPDSDLGNDSWRDRRMHSHFDGRRGMVGGLRLGPPGRWWDNPEMAAKLALTPDQQKRMDDIFQQSRLSLIDLVAAVKKQEVIMQPLLDADQPDETRIIAQIDRIAQARAELEKSNARMLLGLRRVLTLDQWKKLQAMRWHWDGSRESFGSHDGPGEWRDGVHGNGPPPPVGF